MNDSLALSWLERQCPTDSLKQYTLRIWLAMIKLVPTTSDISNDLKLAWGGNSGNFRVVQRTGAEVDASGAIPVDLRKAAASSLRLMASFGALVPTKSSVTTICTLVYR